MSTPTIVIPSKASTPVYYDLLTEARAQGADIQTVYSILDKIDANEKRAALIAKTDNFKPTQIKLYFRSASEEEILKAVPDSDVFDDIAVQDLKRLATGKKRITTTEKELKEYQALKADGVTDIIYDTDKESIVAKPVVAAEPPNKDDGSDGEDAGAAESAGIDKPDASASNED